jgi:hypothetical protein
LVLGFPLIVEWEEEGKWREGIETGGWVTRGVIYKTKEISNNQNQSKIINKKLSVYLCCFTLFNWIVAQLFCVCLNVCFEGLSNYY